MSVSRPDAPHQIDHHLRVVSVDQDRMGEPANAELHLPVGSIHVRLRVRRRDSRVYVQRYAHLRFKKEKKTRKVR